MSKMIMCSDLEREFIKNVSPNESRSVKTNEYFDFQQVPTEKICFF